jgi:hypothetical protein
MLGTRRGATLSKEDSYSSSRSRFTLTISVDRGVPLILDIPAPFPLTAGELRDLAYAAYMDREREYFDELELI